MTVKSQTFCDVCEQEIKWQYLIQLTISWGEHLIHKYAQSKWGMTRLDFCSRKCMLVYMNEKFGEKSQDDSKKE